MCPLDVVTLLPNFRHIFYQSRRFHARELLAALAKYILSLGFPLLSRSSLSLPHDRMPGLNVCLYSTRMVVPSRLTTVTGGKICMSYRKCPLPVAIYLSCWININFQLPLFATDASCSLTFAGHTHPLYASLPVLSVHWCRVMWRPTWIFRYLECSLWTCTKYYFEVCFIAILFSLAFLTLSTLSWFK